jgi:hypothetical protein
MQVISALGAYSIAPAKAVSMDSKTDFPAEQNLVWWASRDTSPDTITEANLEDASLSVDISSTRINYKLENNSSVCLDVDIILTPVSPLLRVRWMQYCVSPHNTLKYSLIGRWRSAKVHSYQFLDPAIVDV